MGWRNFIPKKITDLYEIRDCRHAGAILASEFPQEFKWKFSKTLTKLTTSKTGSRSIWNGTAKTRRSTETSLRLGRFLITIG